jgi:DNA-binding transcriptional LysR family regulator
MTNLSALHDMTLFVNIARLGSFTRASEALGVPGATLSRRIRAMEREFGVQLFDRTTRRVELTAAGRRYFERCGHLVDEARLAQEALRDDAKRPSGHVRVSMPVDLGVYIIGPLMPDFVRQYPGISFDLDLSPHRTDLMGEHVDVAIRIGAILDDKLVAKTLGFTELALFASPTYLDMRGRPTVPSDLALHECLIMRNPKQQATWHLLSAGDKMASRQEAQVCVSGRFALNNIGLMQQFAERGVGIGTLSIPLVLQAVKEGRLEQVLPEWRLPALPIQAVMTSRLQTASVRAFINYLAARLALV